MSLLKGILILGAEGGGKSLLVKRIQLLLTSGIDAEFIDIPSTVATVGSNVMKIQVGKVEYELREVGGVMAPIWKNYYKNYNAIIYVIDRANQFQISASCVLLLTLLSSEMTSRKQVLILFNKTDFPCKLALAELKKIYRLKDIINNAKQAITVVECSCVEKYGFTEIIDWLQGIACY